MYFEASNQDGEITQWPLTQFAEGTSKISPGKETFQQILETGTTIVLGSLKHCPTEQVLLLFLMELKTTTTTVQLWK